MPLLLVDPGHGGDRAVGKSTPFGVRGPRGTVEKDVTLEVARRLSSMIPRWVDCRLTRDADRNVSIAARAAAARNVGADVFVSIHANEGPIGSHGSQVWVHERARPAATELAHAIAHELGSPSGVQHGSLALLDPNALPTAAACLVEVEYLSEPSGEALLRDPSTLDQLARKLARAIETYLSMSGAHPRHPRAHHNERVPLSYDATYGAVMPTAPTCTPVPGRWYAGAQKSVAGLVGFECCIQTDAAIRLPCEGTATFHAKSNAWTGVTKSDISKWAQFGYKRVRETAGDTSVVFARYIEVNAGSRPADYFRRYYSAPAAGTHRYTGVLDGTSGQWSFSFDRAAFDSWTHAGWTRNTGDRVDYNTEIYDKNSNMVGTPRSHVPFSDCKYKTGASFVSAGLVAGNVSSSDPAFGARFVNGTTVEVWDTRR